MIKLYLSNTNESVIVFILQKKKWSYIGVGQRDIMGLKAFAVVVMYIVHLIRD